MLESAIDWAAISEEKKSSKNPDARNREHLERYFVIVGSP